MLRWKGQESKLKALHSPQLLISPTAMRTVGKHLGMLLYVLTPLCSTHYLASAPLGLVCLCTDQTLSRRKGMHKKKTKNPRKVCEPSDDWWYEARPQGDTGTQDEGERVWVEVSSLLVFGLSSRLAEMQPAFVWLKQWAVLAWVIIHIYKTIHPSMPGKRTNKAQVIMKDIIKFAPVVHNSDNTDIFSID